MSVNLRNVVVGFRYPGYHLKEYSVVFMAEDFDDLKDQVYQWLQNHSDVVPSTVNFYS